MLAVICEDQADDRALLAGFCDRYAKEKHLPVTVLAFENAGALLKDRAAWGADVLFLDIYMEGALGVDAARILRGKGFPGAIVFTTTSREHYADGFEVEAAHYLSKPVAWPSFCEAMRRVLGHSLAQARTVRVTVGRTEVEVDVTGLWYIEVYGHKTILHTSKGPLTANQSLTALEGALRGDPFLRCYRYFLVNMDFVERVTEDAFLMKDGREIPLSRDGRAAIKNRYLSYVFKRMEG